MAMKNSSDIIGNRNRDRPACSAYSQPTASPCVLAAAVIVVVVVVAEVVVVVVT